MLIDQLQTLCQRLSGEGWQALLQSVAGLNINQPSAGELATELARPLDPINRTLPGFEDFNPAGKRGITPGNPSASLLYHALASPGVQRKTLTYPTLADLDLVENYIFAKKNAELDTYRILADGRPLGVVTFAYDYRPASETVQGAYADWVLSRTGVQRVGNQSPAYVPAVRAFVPWKEGDSPSTVRVMPARYAAFLAVKLQGNDTLLGQFGPLDKGMIGRVLRNQTLFRMLPGPHQEAPKDDEIEFWVPLHKLFPGDECLIDFSGGDSLTVDFEVEHRNMKLQRQWRQLASVGYPLDLETYDVNDVPFIRDEELATRSTTATDGPCLVVPTPHTAFNAQAKVNGTSDPLPFPVKRGYDAFVKDITGDDEAYGWFWTSFYIPTEGDAHRAPEYVNVRGKLTSTGVVDLNATQADLADYLETHAFDAESFEDYSADGWVYPEIPQLMSAIDPPDFVSAYSLVTAPAFFPYVRQRELMEWSVDRFADPSTEWAKVWNVLPVALCHDRIAPNVELQNSGFEIEDVSVSAIVSLLAPAAPVLQTASAVRPLRTSFLPDAAAGTYAPGWETSYDRDPMGEPFLAAYGLGSPFAEDAMICSALGTFWPGPAPDTSRLFPAMSYRTEAPLTDTEVGVPNATTSWDGVPAPIFDDDGVSILFMNPDYVDYTRDATLRVQPFMAIDTKEFTGRVTSMYNALSAVGVKPNKETVVAYRRDALAWRVLLFRRIEPSDSGFQNAWRSAKPGIKVAGPYYSMRLAQIAINNNTDARTNAGAQLNQLLGTIVGGTDYDIYTFAGGALRALHGTGSWKFFGAPR